MPGERKQPLRFHLLHCHFHDHMLEAGMGDAAAGDLAGGERRFEAYAEPLAELFVVGQRPPDPGDRSVQFDLFVNTISA